MLAWVLPLEGRFAAAVSQVRLFDQIEAAENVGNVVEAPYLCLEAILIYTRLVHETPGS